jgi:hypothetical protein
MTITLTEAAFQHIAATYGVVDNRPVQGLPPSVRDPHVETLFPLASLPELDANAVVTVEQLSLP